MTSTSDGPAAVLLELLTAFGRRDLDAMRSRWTATTSGTLHPLSTTLRNGDEVVRFFTAAFEAIGDLQMDITDVHESHDTAIAQWRLRATVIGEVAGLRPNGAEIDVNGIDVQRIVDGRVDHAGPEDLDPPGPAAHPARGVGLARGAGTERAADVDLGRRLGEREHARPQADLGLLTEDGARVADVSHLEHTAAQHHHHGVGTRHGVVAG